MNVSVQQDDLKANKLFFVCFSYKLKVPPPKKNLMIFLRYFGLYHMINKTLLKSLITPVTVEIISWALAC